jgi:hypothetical protein
MEKRGKFITCQKCKHKFKFYNIEKRQKWELEKYPCFKCGELYCNKPETERVLFGIQDNYFNNNRDEVYFIELVDILNKYSINLIKKFYSPHVNFREDIDYYALNAVAFIVEEYLAKEEYKIYHSFAGAIRGKIKQAFLCKNELLTPGISLTWDFKDGKNVFYEDEKHNFIYNIEEKEHFIGLHKYMLELIFSVEKYCDPYEDYKRILALRHYLKSGEKKADILFQEEIKDERNNISQFRTYGRFAKEKYLTTLDLIRKELLRASFFSE